MNSWQALADSPVIQRMGWTLLHSVWQGLAVAIGLALILPAVRRRGARAAYGVCCGALLLTVLLPATTIFMLPDSSTTQTVSKTGATASIASATAKPPMPSPPMPPGVLVTSDFPPPRTVDRVPASPIGVVFPPAVTAGEPSFGERAASIWRQIRAQVSLWLPWAVFVWTSGVLALSLWNVGGWFAVHRLKTREASPVSATIQHAAARIAAQLRLVQSVRVLQSALVESPIVIGAIKPVILLPASLITGLPPDQLESLLAHELAHVLRQDYLVNLLQSTIETLLFYHPAVRWISAQVRAERENCCDDLAVGIASDRAIYVRALASVAGARASTMVPAATGGLLLPRLRRILGVVDPQTAHPARWLTGALLLLLSASAIAFLVVDSRSATAQTPASNKNVVATDSKPQSTPSNNTASTDETLPGGASLRLGDLRLRPGDLDMHTLTDIVFLPDGKTLVSMSGNSIKFWDVASGRLIRQAEGKAGLNLPSTDPSHGRSQITELNKDDFHWVQQRKGVLSPDGKRLAIGEGHRRDVQIWDVKTRKMEISLTDGSNRPLEIGRLEFNPDGSLLVAANWVMIRRQFIAAILVWDARTGELRRRFSVPEMFPRTFAISPDGKHVAAGTTVALHVWDLATGAQVGNPINGHEGFISTVLFSPKSDRIITASDDFSCRIWDSVSGREIARLDHNKWVRAAAISTDGTLVATSSLDDTVGIWQSASGKRLHSLKGHGELGGKRALEFSPDGAVLYSWGDDRKLRVWNTKSGQLIKEFTSNRSGTDDSTSDPTDFDGLTRRLAGQVAGIDIESVCFLSGGYKLVLAGRNGYWVFETQTGKVLTKRSTSFKIDTIAPMHGQNRLVLTRRPRQVTKQSPSGTSETVGSEPARVTVLDLDSGATVWSKKMPGSWGLPIIVSRDDKLLAVADRERSNASIRLLDARSGKELKTIEGADPMYSGPNPGAFSPDGRRLAFAQRNATVLIWDLDRLGFTFRR